MARRRPPEKPTLDLNLLVVLDALLVERSVTRAASRLGLSQSATSHALARLRDHFGDPLLVRTGDKLALTARATDLAEPVRGALAQLDGAVRGARAFDPARARRAFTVAMADHVGALLLPPLHARLARAAPDVDLRVAAVHRDIEAALDSDAADLLVTMSSGGDDAPGLYQQRLFDDRYVCVVRRGHPATRRALTVEAYAALPHLLIAPRGGRGIVDRELAARGLARRVAMQVPHALVAPHVVAASDLVLTVIARFARAYADILPLEVLDVPLALPALTCRQRWHERSHHDPAHAWLRARVVEAAAAI